MNAKARRKEERKLRRALDKQTPGAATQDEAAPREESEQTHDAEATGSSAHEGPASQRAVDTAATLTATLVSDALVAAGDRELSHEEWQILVGIHPG